MGNVKVAPCRHREDWGLEDPGRKSDGEFIKTARTIKNKVLDLKERIENNKL